MVQGVRRVRNVLPLAVASDKAGGRHESLRRHHGTSSASSSPASLFPGPGHQRENTREERGSQVDCAETTATAPYGTLYVLCQATADRARRSLLPSVILRCMQLHGFGDGLSSWLPADNTCNTRIPSVPKTSRTKVMTSSAFLVMVHEARHVYSWSDPTLDPFANCELASVGKAEKGDDYEWIVVCTNTYVWCIGTQLTASSVLL